ncbi:MAG: tripartite tricarboxylate transporter TctB family protein [Rhizobiales bacterium]|nr:tripartite tricarboxylate transporter TctB family protein [Hyphomicrobiales bacterium]MBO6698541.1 tripartite tricarboxylate transporter TctB family protein [Hyphomicrobiales bacterium]MBO6735205.1 tripartite tricarboxylate transporter TctB family protein [Hyphomicrobiales bacterium]MBO6910987.1 tripartite tricarboxylate transporter TctB family protein [Hyphomicrobiales bacterium]MBO6956030.1 tripartite tricarboxylate transporter TctB family protein [Hyphomicrobiales bacterium]
MSDELSSAASDGAAARLRHRDMLPALVLFALGAYAMWEANAMSVMGRVFPTLASMGLLLGSIALATRAFIWQPAPVFAVGTVARPLLLLAVLIGWAVFLPVVGFVPVSIAGALLVSLVAEQEQRTRRGLLIQAAGLITLVMLIALVFGQFLKVNLP